MKYKEVVLTFRKEEKKNAWNPWYCIYIYIYIIKFNRSKNNIKNIPKLTLEKEINKMIKAMCFRGT